MDLVSPTSPLQLGKNITEEIFAKSCKFRVGDGFSTSFWHSNWANDEVLKDIFLVLFEFSILQDVVGKKTIGLGETSAYPPQMRLRSLRTSCLYSR